MLLLVLSVLLAMSVVMTAGWLYQRYRENGGWTDVFWTFGTGLTCSAAAAAAGGSGPGWRRALVAGMVAAWAVRLGAYIAVRVARSAEDTRYAVLREEWGAGFQGKMFLLLVSQAPITALLSVGVIFAARQPDLQFRLADALGGAVLLLSIVGETVADAQMKRFKSDRTPKSAVCRSGLWAWSRHPNYFFEALGWLAYPLIGLDLSNPWSWSSFVAPILMYLVVRYLTGVPPLERAMLRSKGDAYREYQEEVSGLFPRPPVRRRA